MNTKRDILSFLPRLVLVTFALIFMIFGARYCATTWDPRSGPVNVTVIVPETPLAPPDTSVPVSIGPVVIESDVYEVECGPDGEVISAVMGFQVHGGIAPYEITFDPSDTTIPNIQSGSIVKFTLPGGHSLTTTVKSNSPDGEPTGSSDIRAPSRHPECEEPTPTSHPSLTVTVTQSATGVATRTKPGEPDPTLIVFFTPPTNTQVSSSVTPSTPLVKTNTPLTPAVKTKTPSTPAIKTNTPFTSRISTNTPVVRTKTPIPPTLTPVPADWAECQDGRDNDGDELVDLQDPDCRSGNDNHENK